MTDKINEEFKKTLISKIPQGELGSGEDVSNCSFPRFRHGKIY